MRADWQRIIAFLSVIYVFLGSIGDCQRGDIKAPDGLFVHRAYFNALMGLA
jgi:hypothetical protein